MRIQRYSFLTNASREAHILKPPWDTMFTDEEKEIARRRLIDCGYIPD